MRQVWRAMCFLVLSATILMAQSPVQKTFAYSRSTVPGVPDRDNIPDARNNPLPVSYLIYIVVKKGAAVSTTGVWLRGKYYNVSLQKIHSPVMIAHDAAVPTGKQDTLVKKTSGDVYQVRLDAEKQWNDNDTAADKLTQENEVVVVLKAGLSTFYASVKNIKALPPAYGM